MTRPAVARTARVRKARRTSRCRCGAWINIGNLIVNRGQGWICIGCALAAIRKRQEDT